MSSSYHHPAFLNGYLPDFITAEDIKKNPCLVYALINFAAWANIVMGAIAQWRKTQPPLKGTKRGRPSIGPMGMLKIIFIQMLKGWSNNETATMIAEDTRYRNFIGFKHPPKAKTIWKWKNIFFKYHVMSKIFRFDVKRVMALFAHVGTKVVAIDSTLIRVPIQRNTKKENDLIRKGKGNKLWKDNPYKRRQKDIKARWSKKHGKSRFGYSAHTFTDVPTKLVLHFDLTPSNVHDAKQADSMINWLPEFPENVKPNGVLADNSPCFMGDSAYHSAKIHRKVEARGWRDCTVYKKPKGGELTEWQKEYNHSLSQIRSRVEHPYGMMKNACAGLMVFCKGIKKVTEEVAGRLWAYNLNRLLHFGA